MADSDGFGNVLGIGIGTLVVCFVTNGNVIAVLRIGISGSRIVDTSTGIRTDSHVVAALDVTAGPTAQGYVLHAFDIVACISTDGNKGTIATGTTLGRILACLMADGNGIIGIGLDPVADSNRIGIIGLCFYCLTSVICRIANDNGLAGYAGATADADAAFCRSGCIFTNRATAPAPVALAW